MQEHASRRRQWNFVLEYPHFERWAIRDMIYRMILGHWWCRIHNFIGDWIPCLLRSSLFPGTLSWLWQCHSHSSSGLVASLPYCVLLVFDCFQAIHHLTLHYCLHFHFRLCFSFWDSWYIKYHWSFDWDPACSWHHTNLCPIWFSNTLGIGVYSLKGRYWI